MSGRAGGRRLAVVVVLVLGLLAVGAVVDEQRDGSEGDGGAAQSPAPHPA